MSTTSDIFALVLEGIMRCSPELQADRFVAWRVQSALAAATFTEWARFTKGNLRDVFHSASRFSEKAGARDAQYARVSQPLKASVASLHSL